MQRPKGYRCPGSGINSGFPHGKHKKEERRKLANERAALKTQSGTAKPSTK